jgi:hypothetical protein
MWEVLTEICEEIDNKKSKKKKENVDEQHIHFYQGGTRANFIYYFRHCATTP